MEALAQEDIQVVIAPLLLQRASQLAICTKLRSLSAVLRSAEIGRTCNGGDSNLQKLRGHLAACRGGTMGAQKLLDNRQLGHGQDQPGAQGRGTRSQ